jgi:hypothetical protein
LIVEADLAWVLRCAIHLKRLNPKIDGVEATSFARNAFEHTSGLTPEEGAEYFARTHWAFSDTQPLED